MSVPDALDVTSEVALGPLLSQFRLHLQSFKNKTTEIEDFSAQLFIFLLNLENFEKSQRIQTCQITAKELLELIEGGANSAEEVLTVVQNLEYQVKELEVKYPVAVGGVLPLGATNILVDLENLKSQIPHWPQGEFNFVDFQMEVEKFKRAALGVSGLVRQEIAGNVSSVDEMKEMNSMVDDLEEMLEITFKTCLKDPRQADFDELEYDLQSKIDEMILFVDNLRENSNRSPPSSLSKGTLPQYPNLKQLLNLSKKHYSRVLSATSIPIINNATSKAYKELYGITSSTPVSPNSSLPALNCALPSAKSSNVRTRRGAMPTTARPSAPAWSAPSINPNPSLPLPTSSRDYSEMEDTDLSSDSDLEEDDLAEQRELMQTIFGKSAKDMELEVKEKQEKRFYDVMERIERLSEILIESLCKNSHAFMFVQDTLIKTNEEFCELIRIEANYPDEVSYQIEKFELAEDAEDVVNNLSNVTQELYQYQQFQCYHKKNTNELIEKAALEFDVTWKEISLKIYKKPRIAIIRGKRELSMEILTTPTKSIGSPNPTPSTERTCSPISLPKLSESSGRSSSPFNGEEKWVHKDSIHNMVSALRETRIRSKEVALPKKNVDLLMELKEQIPNHNISENIIIALTKPEKDGKVQVSRRGKKRLKGRNLREEKNRSQWSVVLVDSKDPSGNPKISASAEIEEEQGKLPLPQERSKTPIPKRPSSKKQFHNETISKIVTDLLDAESGIFQGSSQNLLDKGVQANKLIDWLVHKKYAANRVGALHLAKDMCKLNYLQMYNQGSNTEFNKEYEFLDSDDLHSFTQTALALTIKEAPQQPEEDETLSPRRNERVGRNFKSLAAIKFNDEALLNITTSLYQFLMERNHIQKNVDVLFEGAHLIEWLLQNKYAVTKIQSIKLAKQLFDRKFIESAVGDSKFSADHHLYRCSNIITAQFHRHNPEKGLGVGLGWMNPIPSASKLNVQSLRKAHKANTEMRKSPSDFRLSASVDRDKSMDPLSKYSTSLSPPSKLKHSTPRTSGVIREDAKPIPARNSKGLKKQTPVRRSHRKKESTDEITTTTEEPETQEVERSSTSFLNIKVRKGEIASIPVIKTKLNPFVKIIVHDKQKQTRAAFNDTNPEWNSSFTFSDYAFPILFQCLSKSKDTRDEVIVIGSFQVERDDVPKDDKVVEKWYSFKNGKILLELSFRSNHDTLNEKE